MHDTAGTYIELALRSGAVFMVNRTCLEQIDAAKGRWEMEQKDTMLELPLWCGDTITVAASSIDYAIYSTPRGRERQLAHDVESRIRRRQAFGPDWLNAGDAD